MNAIIHDGLFSPDAIRATRDQWPAAGWPGWINYDPHTQCKLASDLHSPIPPACGVLLAELATLPVRDWFGGELVPDLGLHGAGLHEMPRGPGLAPHLDADTHGRLGTARVLSAVLWVHEYWPPTWGGELEFSDGLIVAPAPGRLVVFDARAAQHAVRPVTCPPDVRRQSLAMFWYSPKAGPGLRPRAQFTDPNGTICPECGQAVCECVLVEPVAMTMYQR